MNTYTFPERPKASKKKHYVMVIPDAHIGYVVDHPTYSIPCWDIVLQALKHNAKRLTHVLILGDFGNWESLSRWAALRADQCFIEEDLALVNNRLDELQAITAKHGIKVVFLEGNHEAWASQFEAKYPAMRDVVNLKKRMRMAERGWTWVPENHFWAIGQQYFTHGHIAGCKSMTDLIKRTGVSVIVGHWHTYMSETLRTLTGEHTAQTFGCIASMDPPPPYVRGSVLSRVVQGFGFVQIRASGAAMSSYRRILEETHTELEDGTELRADIRACDRRYAQDQAIRDALRKEYGERFYEPGGQVVRTEPLLNGKLKNGQAKSGTRTNRARILRVLPDANG
ncbi:hypothetical protein LCGC14_1723430 [marine sediment metagenome]|uniref:Calcineurin-like phosphoesterase domain-containing protein n=1 Tax=marine sediment metagenome TaxID=412755 RepID=A0A0F9JS91_9ZZZZ